MYSIGSGKDLQSLARGFTCGEYVSWSGNEVGGISALLRMARVGCDGSVVGVLLDAMFELVLLCRKRPDKRRIATYKVVERV